MWKWTGKLFFEGQPNSICNVTISHASEHFSSFVSNWDAITLPSFHDVTDVPAILNACKPRTHIAQLGPAEIEDTGPMQTLIAHLKKYQRVSASLFSPVVWLMFFRSSSCLSN